MDFVGLWSPPPSFMDSRLGAPELDISNVFCGSEGLLKFKSEIKLKDRRPRLHKL